ncbi:LCP family protein [Fictibacillus nanhaiensis]|uniref:LCP family protein n=1 Tax=Fictibacillus nanhaiensis TaxID=742169 RepID=UPI002E231C7A|nr:LCP family protein [Fictibacillus nanhaiensis]
MNRKAMRSRRKRRRRILFILVPILVVILASVGYGSYLTYKLANATSNASEELGRGGKSDKREQAVDPSEDHFSVLLAGVDDSSKRGFSANGGYKGVRSDALILATFNREDKSVKMVSLPRDSKVEIPGHRNTDRIAHAHSYGGMDLTVETVEDLFDVPVDYYVKLNFDAFLEIIDALGGVEINVEKEITEQNSKDEAGAIHLEPGVQELTPEEALAYARTRKLDSDIYRGDRQKQLVEAIIKKSASMESIPKYGTVIDTVGDNMATNFTFGNILALFKYAKSIDTIENLKLEGTDDTSTGAYYYQLDESSVEEISEQLKSHLELPGYKYDPNSSENTSEDSEQDTATE